MRTTAQTAWVLSLFFVFVLEIYSQDVIRIPNGSPLVQASLAERWAWAQQEAERRKFRQGFWVGYNVVRLMEESSFYSTHFGDPRRQQTLEEILYGTTYQSHSRSQDYIHDLSLRNKKVQKDIAILFRFQPHVTATSKPEKVSAGNIGLPFDSMEYPIVWLGGARDEESVELLTEQYNASSSIEFRSTILGILSWHEQSENAHSLLRKVLGSKDAEELRKKAALYLGEFDNSETLELLLETAESDRSTVVAESAVIGISRMKTEAAVDALVQLAREAERDGMRKKSVYSLSRFASEKVVSTLQDIIVNDKDIELQKQAVYALARLKHDDYIPQLIALSKSHPNSEIQKYAIYMLGQSKDQRALDALIEIVKQ